MFASTVLVAGAALGVRHALEPDHLAAVGTLVDEGDRRAARVGASWALGHAAPIAALGLLFLLAGTRFPPAVTRLFEAAVGLVLVGLGVRSLLAAAGRGPALARHDHGDGAHRHVGLGSLAVGATHSHVPVHGPAFGVGILHGLAGSGALVVLLVAAAPTVPAALGFLAAFTALSVLTMAVVSGGWRRALDAGYEAALRGLAGVVGVAVGLFLLAETLA